MPFQPRTKMILSGQKDEASIDTDETKNAHGQNHFMCADFMLQYNVHASERNNFLLHTTICILKLETKYLQCDFFCTSFHCSMPCVQIFKARVLIYTKLVFAQRSHYCMPHSTTALQTVLPAATVAAAAAVLSHGVVDEELNRNAKTLVQLDTRRGSDRWCPARIDTKVLRKQ